MTVSRIHHYIFAHKLIPGLVREDGSNMLYTMLSENGDAMLQGLWEQLAADLPEQDVLPADGLRAAVVLLPDDRPLAVVILPPPQVETEAWLLGLVYDQDHVRCFTLEHGADVFTGQAITILGEWTQENRHANYGTVTVRTLGDFAAAVAGQVQPITAASPP